MKVKLFDGSELDLPTPESVREAIKQREDDLRKLRRLRDLMDEFNGKAAAGKADAPADPPAVS